MRRIILYAGKPLCLLLLMSFVLLDLSVHSAKAGLITTEAVIEARQADENRDRVVAFLARDDVQRALVSQGVDPAEAKNRVAALADAEVEKIAGQLDNMPAGAGVGSVVGAVVFIFIVLLITDILGFTNIFPFTRSVQ